MYLFANWVRNKANRPKATFIWLKEIAPKYWKQKLIRCYLITHCVWLGHHSIWPTLGNLLCGFSNLWNPASISLIVASFVLLYLRSSNYFLISLIDWEFAVWDKGGVIDCASVLIAGLGIIINFGIVNNPCELSVYGFCTYKLNE